MNNLTINLLTVWSSVLILFPVFFAFIKDKKASWGKFWIVWFAVIVVSGLVLWLLISKPDSVPQALSSVFNVTNTTN